MPPCPSDVFQSARAAILRPFIDRESIYATAYARDSWEDAARVNLAAELEALTAALPSMRGHQKRSPERLRNSSTPIH